MQNILKRNKFFIIRKIFIIFNIFYKYLTNIINFLIIINLYLLINIYLYIINNKFKFNNLYINKINNNNFFYNNYLHNNKNKFNKFNINKNIFSIKNIKNISNNKKVYFLITHIKIKNNLFIDSINYILNKNDSNYIFNKINKFINIKKLNKNSKLIIFSLFNNSNKYKIDINKLICIKIINKGKKNIYIYNKLNNKYCIFDNKNNFINFPTRKRFKITSKFNLNRLNPITNKISPHKGIDIAMPVGTPILSISNGIIKESSKNSKSGNYIIVKHNNNCLTKYMHLKKSIVKKGQKINLGECIGYSGNSGRSTGPHLHFEIWINFKAVNPLTIKLNKKYYNMLYINDIKKLIFNIESNIPKNILI